jgi:hypothetical protein
LIEQYEANWSLTEEPLGKAINQLGRYTQNARTVLTDCESLVDEFRDDAVYLKHRFKWVAAMALLRTVGHVLAKVDATSSASAKRAIDKAWQKLCSSNPEPKIFWRFIEEGRNLVLKEYQLGVITRVRAEGRVLPKGVSTDQMSPKRAKVEYLITWGEYAGRSQKEVLLEAIAWWKGYLDEIDK